MNSIRLADDVLVVSGAYVEEHLTAIATGDGLILVDTLATLPATRAALPLIRAFSSEPVRVVINTHLDADHVAGNHAFAGAAIVAHQNGRRRLDQRLFDDGAAEPMIRGFVEQLRSSEAPGDPRLAARRQTYIDMYTALLEGFADFASAPPFLFVPSGAHVALGRATLELRHFGPAHTDADLVVVLPGRDLFVTGDVAVGAGVTPIAHVHLGGSLLGLAHTLAALDDLATDAARFVPGHGPIAGKTQIREQRAYVEALLDRVREAQARGLTLAEARAGLDLAAFSGHLLYDLVHAAHVDLAWREIAAQSAPLA